MEQNADIPATFSAADDNNTGNGLQELGQLENSSTEVTDGGASIPYRRESESSCDTRSTTDSTGSSSITQTTSTGSETAFRGSSSSPDNYTAPKEYQYKNGDGYRNRKTYAHYFDKKNEVSRRASTYDTRSEYEMNRTLWVGNIPVWANDEQVVKIFSKAGEIKRIFMPKKATKFTKKESSKFAFIGYRREESVPRALEMLYGATLFERVLRLAARHGSIHEAHASELEKKREHERNSTSRKEELKQVRELAKQRMQGLEMVSIGDPVSRNVDARSFGANDFGVNGDNHVVQSEQITSAFQLHALEFQQRQRQSRGQSMIQQPCTSFSGLQVNDLNKTWKSGSSLGIVNPDAQSFEAFQISSAAHKRTVEYKPFSAITYTSTPCKANESIVKLKPSTENSITESPRDIARSRESLQFSRRYEHSGNYKSEDKERKYLKRKWEYDTDDSRHSRDREHSYRHSRDREHYRRRSSKDVKYSRASNSRYARKSYYDEDRAKATYQHRHRSEARSSTRHRYEGRSVRKRESEGRSRESKQHQHPRKTYERLGDTEKRHRGSRKSPSESATDRSLSVPSGGSKSSEGGSYESGTYSATSRDSSDHHNSADAKPGSGSHQSTSSSLESIITSAPDNAALAALSQVPPDEVKQLLWSNLDSLNSIAATMGLQVTTSPNVTLADVDDLNQAQKDKDSTNRGTAKVKNIRKKRCNTEKLATPQPEDKTLKAGKALCRIM